MHTETNDKRTRWLALYVLCLGDLMIVLDQSIVNVALPSIRTDLGFSPGLAGLGGQRLPADLRRLPAAVRPARRPARQPPGASSAASSSFTLASVACGLRARPRRSSSSAAPSRASAVPRVSAVALALIMGLFSEPGERAKAMGVFGFVMSGGGAVGVLLGGVLTGLLIVALDLPRERARSASPSGSWPPARCCPTTSSASARQARRARRRPGHRRADARGVRRGRRQRRRLDLDPHPRHPGHRRRPARRLRGPRGPGRRPAGPAAAVPAAQRRRSPRWSACCGPRAMFAWFFLAALYLQQVLGLRRPRGRPGVRPDQRW